MGPDSIRSVDPDTESEYGSGSKRAKMIHKNRKKVKFHVLKCWMFSSEGLNACFSCSLDVLYGGLGISKFFLQFLGHQNPWIRKCIQPKMLDPDSKSPDPKHWFFAVWELVSRGDCDATFFYRSSLLSFSNAPTQLGSRFL